MKKIFTFTLAGWMFSLGILTAFPSFGQEIDTAALKIEYEELKSLENDAYRESRYQEAIEHTKKAIELCKVIYGEQHEDYVTLLNNLAGLHAEMGQHDEALPLFKQTLKTAAKTLGKKHPGYGANLNNLAWLYVKMGRYGEAAPLYRQALEIAAETLGKEHPDYGKNLNNLALFYAKTSQYEEAIPLFKQALDIAEKSQGKEHPDYGTRLNYLALLYVKMDQYEDALPLLDQALDIAEKTRGKEHPGYATSLNSLAFLYSKMERYEEAAPLYRQALEITAKTLGKEHPNYGTSLNNLAFLYSNMNRYEEAAPLYRQAIEVTAKALGKKHPHYGTRLNNLALLYTKMGQYEEALPLFILALEITEKALGKKHEQYATNLHNLALLYYKMNRYDEAAPLFHQSLTVIANVLGKKHSQYGAYLNNLVSNHEATGQPLSAEDLIIQAIIIDQYKINHQITYVAENIQEDWLINSISNSNIYQSFLQRHPENDSLLGKIISHLLLLNSFQLSAKKQLHKDIKLADFETKALYKEWLNLKKCLAKELSLPTAERRPDIDSIIQVAERKETALATQSKVFAESRKVLELSDIQKKLNPNEALLQFSHFHYKDTKEWTDSTLYVAYLVYPNKTAQMVYLFEQKQIDSLFLTTRNGIDIYARGQGEGVKPSRSLNSQQLHQFIWQPILPHLKDISTLYVNPSGLLHKINLGEISIDSTSRISDKFKVNYISSARNFVLEQEKKHPNTALIIGGINYDEYKKREDPPTFSTNEIAMDRGSQNNAFKYLRGTEKEANMIQKRLSKKSYDVTLLTNRQGTEYAIKKYNGAIASPRILHIATHGYFFPHHKKQQDDNDTLYAKTAYRFSEDPLIRTGLILAGANKAWQGQSPPLGQEDGILTAYEISHLDLSNTELVVLSACETALGDIQGTEGVYGLQRGFKMAGVKYIVMSLWKVPDHETQEMMVLFYQKWLEGGLAIPDAFRAAQKEMRMKYENEPFKWAGFILVE